MNAVNETFICTERKWTQWTKCSFPLNGNERSERTVQLYWMEMNVLIIFSVHFRSFSSFWPFLSPFYPKKAFFLVILGDFWQGWALRSFPFRTYRSFPFIFWTERSFPFIFRVFGDLWNPNERFVHFRSFLMNGNERSEQNVHLYWTEMNAVNKTFIATERKWTQWTKRSFVLNRNERSERNIHFHWTEMNAVNEMFI